MGTVDILLVETTPLVIEDRLYRFESVRPEYWNSTMPALASDPGSGRSYFRFVDVATGEPTHGFASQVRWRYLECLPAMTRLEFIGADMTHHSNTVDKANQ
jgi:hypothetical protein